MFENSVNLFVKIVSFFSAHFPSKAVANALIVSANEFIS
jgi:hypothetical protein